VAHLHRKVKKGRPYYYIREIKRVGGKPKVVAQLYLGTADNIALKFQQIAKATQPIKLRAEEFGSLFIICAIEKQLDTIGIIDSIIAPASRETGPSIGEYFFYAWANRLIDPKSKRGLEEWYRKTAIQMIRPVAVDELTSMRYWEKWNRVDAESVEKIGRAFFEKVWSSQDVPPESVLFDTTNYYTFMASETESDLCQRGKNKQGRHHLRQVGLALMVDRGSQLPLHYQTYEGNRHDSKLFERIIDEMFGILLRFNPTKQRLTVVFDKGMNSDENIGTFDDQSRVHFITTYSPYFVEDLATTDLKHFAPIVTRSNEHLEELGKSEEKLLAYRTRIELWGKERTVVITHNPITRRKKIYTLDRKLETLRDALLEFRTAYRDARPQWREPEVIRGRYERLCERLHIGSSYYDIEFGDQRREPEMSFRKNLYQIEKSVQGFGRNVIVTDNHDWSTDEIVQLSLDRNYVEKQFRASKDHGHVSINPFFHWTDGKIRCQLLTCVIALTVMRLIELKIKASGVITTKGSSSGSAIIEEMRALHSIWGWYPRSREPKWYIEAPTKTQADVLKAFGYEIIDGGVLQPING
jgi:transposase